MSSADGVVSQSVLRNVTRRLTDDYSLPPKVGQMIVQDLAAIRAECLPRLEEMKHGQVMVLTTDSHSAIGAACVPEEQRLRPMIVTVFTERERQALMSNTITYPKACRRAN